MSKNRSKLPDVSALLKAPSPFESNAERLAAMLGSPRANFRPGAQGEAGGDEIADLAQFMAQNGRQLVAAVKASGDVARVARSALERTDELAANLQSVEQRMAVLGNAGFVGALAPPSVGSTLAQKISAGEAPDFERFSAGNSPKFSMALGSSIRAVLVGEGSGSSDQGTMPSRPEFAGIVGPVNRPLTLMDVLPTRPVSSDSVEHVRLGVAGDASEQVAHGDAKAELEFSGEAVRSEIATVAAIAHASRQVLSDNAALANVINVTMTGKVLSRLEDQLLNGPGTSGKIHGLLELAAVHTPTATTPADRLGEAVSGMAAAGYQPSVICLHPGAWFRIVSERGGDQHYVLGQPTAPLQPSIWGCRVVTTPSIPENRALVLDPRFSTILDRERVQVAISESHADHFVKNLVAVRCELRAGLEFTDVDSAWTFDLEDAESSSS